MSMGTGGSGGGVKADINVTPLVDVVLVLLIIFMVVTPMLQDGVDVQLPQTAKPQEKAKDEKNQVTISIKYGAIGAEGGEIYFGADFVDMVGLNTQLAELRERNPGSQILVKVDRRLTFGIVKKVMKACNQKGFENVALITQQISA